MDYGIWIMEYEIGKWMDSYRMIFMNIDTLESFEWVKDLKEN